MALTRTYPQNPYIDRTVGFLANWLLGARQTANQQAALDSAENARIGQGIGGMAAGPLNVYSQESSAARRLADQIRLAETEGGIRQRAQDSIYNRQMDVQKQRDAADSFQNAQNAYVKQYGEMPAQAFGQPAMAMPETEAYTAQMDASGALGPPSVDPNTMIQPPQSGVPLPSVNPAMTQEWKQARDGAHKRAMAIEVMRLDPSIPPDHKRAMMEAYMPQVIRDQELLRKYPEQKPPTTFEEMMQAGAANGGITVAPDGSWIVPKGFTRAMPPKAEPFSPPQNPAETDAYIRTMIPNYDELKSKGVDFFIQPNGNIEQVKPENGSGDVDKGIDKQVNEIFKMKNSGDENSRTSMSAAEIAKEKLEIEKDVRAAPIVDRIKKMKRRKISMDEYAALSKEIESAFGGHPLDSPPELWSEFYSLGAQFRKKLPAEQELGN